MKEDGKLHIKLDMRNDPQTADDKSLVWVRAQVYATVGNETYIPPAQDVTFQIEDGGVGQSNAVFEDTGTKKTDGNSSETTGWTPWRYFKSKQAGTGTLQAYLTADKTVSDTKDFTFEPAYGDLPSSGVLEVFGQAYYWSNFSPYPGLVGSYAPSPYDAVGYYFEPGDNKDTVKIRDSRSRYVLVSDSWVSMSQPGAPGTVFTVGLVKGHDSAITLEANGRYVCAYPSGYTGLNGYDLLANGTSGDDPAAFFQVQPKPVPPFKVTITSCPATLKLGESGNVSGTLVTGLNVPVASATCDVNYRNTSSENQDTLRGPSQTQCTDGKFSFTVTADVMPPMSEADVVVRYPSPDYTASDGKWIRIIADEKEA